jgi:hypothetical protein
MVVVESEMHSQVSFQHGIPGRMAWQPRDLGNSSNMVRPGEVPQVRKKRRKRTTNKVCRRVAKWTPVEISAFIEHTVGLPQYAAVFRAQYALSGKHFLEITPNMLCNIGIKNYADQVRIVEFVKKLRMGDAKMIPTKT